ncbi:hypothetical protein BJV78DRAFT_1156825 [Lactifluus subvellereus]|nr:hypothetical protein BJV78DRAFT_1156825 [Lactifluus subvellereus]
MAIETQPPPSSFSRVRFGLGPKTPRSRIPPESPQDPNDADWYIPYNGPYELPPTVPRSHNRDSWGQLLGSVLSNLGGTKSSDALHEWSSGGRITSPLPSSGAYSSHPYRMNAAPDALRAPGPSTTASQGRTAISQSLRGSRPRLNTISSVPFANIDTTGGVGESPTPVQRSPLYTSPPASASSRLSFTSFLPFGASTRKPRSNSNPASRQPSAKRSRNDAPTHDPLQSNHATTLDPQSSRSRSPVRHRPRRRSNTLITTFMTAARTSSHNSSPTSFHHSDSLPSTHPYAYTFPSTWTETSQRAPAVSPAAPHSFDKGKGVDRSYQYPPPPPPDTQKKNQVPPHLKPASRTSLFKTISTPNLRNLSHGLSDSKPTRGKYRWLSPETWCDAMLFPRPRFMVHTDDEPPQPFSHRHVPIIRPPEPRTGGERTALPPIRLLASQSAVNLRATNPESSSGPPRAEPLWIARPTGSFDGHGPSSPGRSRSFAQDDLALPSSPVPSLSRVLEMSASFERERAEWKAKAARSLQSSKLTRSLGRSRTQSTGRTRAQLKDVGGMGFLATKTLLGNQLAAPTVHTSTSSDGSQTQHTRSGTSHARTMSSGGHSGAGSRSKAALRAATGLCFSGDNISPKDELFTRHDGDGKNARIESSPPKLDVGLAPSPLVSNNNSTIGIALSSPPSSAVQDATESSRPIYVPDHPYAQSSHSPPRRSYTRSSSDYAGPHPSAVLAAAPATVVTSDMSARHRLPPHVVLHPYASALAYPNAASSQHSQEHPPILLKGSHQTPAESATPPQKSTPQKLPLRPSPLSDTREAGRAAPHAYASGSRSSGVPLVLADALSFGLQRRFSADSGLGDSEIHHEAPSSAAQLLTSLPSWALTAPPEHPDLGHSMAFLSLHSNHTISSSPVETLDPPVFTASMLTYSSLGDEPLPGSHASSPQQSPPPLSRLEDLDRYRNLFYRPRPSGSSRTPSDEHPRVSSRDTGSLDVNPTGSVSSASGLVGPTRQLGGEFEAMLDVRHLDGTGSLRDSPPRMWGLRYGGTRGGDGTGTRTDPNVVLSVASDLEMNSPEVTRLPLSLHRNLGRPSDASLTIHIPQDVESRASSVLDRSEIEDADHDELLRVGTIEAVSTPAATTAAHRFSFAGDIHGGRSQDSLPPPPVPVAAVEYDEDLTHLPLLVVPTYHHSASHHPSSLPSATTEVTRSSYTTNTTNDTGTSRISGLSDFPVPPTHTAVSSDRSSMLKSYFGDAHSRPVSQTDAPRTAASRSRHSSLAGPSQLSPERHASEPSAP